MGDFSDPVTKALPDRESCPPRTRVGARWMHCSLWREMQSRMQTPLAGHTPHIYIPSPGTFIPKSLYLRPWAEVFFRQLCWDLLIEDGLRGKWQAGGKEGGPWRCLFPFQLSTQDFFPPSPSLWPHPPPQDPKTIIAFCSRLPQQWDDPHICTDPPLIIPWGKRNRGICFLWV